ncbi:unnamed protein product [Schistosoma curassoni]|uniref:Transposase n=1 Tax=Schistosoma curassoni TaxID=6186 RepID=A0A183KQV5_9TREM|nr:unnamed protein product [Schistosoma curassoni]
MSVGWIPSARTYCGREQTSFVRKANQEKYTEGQWYRHRENHRTSSLNQPRFGILKGKGKEEHATTRCTKNWKQIGEELLETGNNWIEVTRTE